MVKKTKILGALVIVACALGLASCGTSSSRISNLNFKPNETQVTYREFWDAAFADEYTEYSKVAAYAKTVVKYKREGKEVNYTANPGNSYTYSFDFDKKTKEMDSSISTRCYKYYVENGKCSAPIYLDN